MLDCFDRESIIGGLAIDAGRGSSTPRRLYQSRILDLGLKKIVGRKRLAVRDWDTSLGPNQVCVVGFIIACKSFAKLPTGKDRHLEGLELLRTVKARTAAYVYFAPDPGKAIWRADALVWLESLDADQRKVCRVPAMLAAAPIEIYAVVHLSLWTRR